MSVYSGTLFFQLLGYLISTQTPPSYFLDRYSYVTSNSLLAIDSFSNVSQNKNKFKKKKNSTYFNMNFRD